MKDRKKIIYFHDSVQNHRENHEVPPIGEHLKMTSGQTFKNHEEFSFSDLSLRMVALQQ